MCTTLQLKPICPSRALMGCHYSANTLLHKVGSPGRPRSQADIFATRAARSPYPLRRVLLDSVGFVFLNILVSKPG